MSVIFVALPIAILMGAAAVIACVRCISIGQFDDLQSPPLRMLIDERPETQSRPEPQDAQSESEHGDDALSRSDSITS